MLGILKLSRQYLGFPGGSLVKNLPANAGDTGLIPGSVRSPGEGSGNPLQYSRLGNLMDRGAWQATVHWITRGGHDLAADLAILGLSAPGTADTCYLPWLTPHSSSLISSIMLTNYPSKSSPTDSLTSATPSVGDQLLV